MATNPRVAAYEASKKATPSSKPTIGAGIKQVNLDKPRPTIGAGIRQVNLDKPRPKPTPTAKAKAPAKSKVNPEKLLQQYLKQGMSLDKARKKVSAETGIWPNGYTN